VRERACACVCVCVREGERRGIHLGQAQAKDERQVDREHHPREELDPGHDRSCLVMVC
jgi:hypothetical protein